MMSNRSESGKPSGGGRGIFIALIPWIVFTVLASHSSLKLGSLGRARYRGAGRARRTSEADRGRRAQHMTRVRSQPKLLATANPLDRKHGRSHQNAPGDGRQARTPPLTVLPFALGLLWSVVSDPP